MPAETAKPRLGKRIVFRPVGWRVVPQACHYLEMQWNACQEIFNKRWLLLIVCVFESFKTRSYAPAVSLYLKCRPDWAVVCTFEIRISTSSLKPWADGNLLLKRWSKRSSVQQLVGHHDHWLLRFAKWARQALQNRRQCNVGWTCCFAICLDSSLWHEYTWINLHQCIQHGFHIFVHIVHVYL